jgi:hypothetical protein
VFFQRLGGELIIEQIGLIEVRGEMEVTPYMTLTNLPGSHWEIIGIEKDSLILAKRDVEQDSMLSFYRIPIR